MSLETGAGCVWKEANPKFTGAGVEVLSVRQWHCQWKVWEMPAQKSGLGLAGMILASCDSLPLECIGDLPFFFENQTHPMSTRSQISNSLLKDD